MKGFVAATLAIMGMAVLYMHSIHNDANANGLRASFPNRQLRPRHPKFIICIYQLIPFVVAGMVNLQYWYPTTSVSMG